jgi:hypothetical protein
MHALINAKVESLTIWNLNVNGKLYNAHGESIDTTNMMMACYFNLGIDAEIGHNFEKTRTRSRICNKILYFFHGVFKVLNLENVNKLKDYISVVQ